ncbi:MAG: phosphopentomutase [Candidatus Dasytiphilus stammeri]
MKKRVFLLVLDSLGIGSTEDARKFGDEGANTLGHIAEFCFKNKANSTIRQGPLKIPHLITLGLGQSAAQSTGKYPLGIKENNNLIGAYAYASPISSGKDTVTGHWEIAGVPTLFDWDYFLEKKNTFPSFLIKKIIESGKLTGYLGNCHASGTIIINEFGEEHIKTLKPIFYTSSDSVFQIACHEEIFGLTRLYQLCKIIRKILNKEGYKICRVIARPFIGSKLGEFTRTDNRYDLVLKPPSSTMLNKLIYEKKGTVISIGKIGNIYAQSGISRNVKAVGLENLLKATIKEMKIANTNTIVFTNFVDFDSKWGHRRDVAGYANGLEFFDINLPKLLSLVKENDMLIITADHGCDPTWYGSNHTRENVPILIYGHNIFPRYLGARNTLADISQTITHYFQLTSMKYGTNML